ncbi:MAG: hypothetical protein A2666_03595 [Parcubacteria group bacterium RIFCSPHIGHO2_01_FULL_47_10b]|nr:MAG: hypothetical protein A2666_03595 [Parcubacteria group bacterium RIFCSPHIGHO2_01_FULL_47_10b]
MFIEFIQRLQRKPSHIRARIALAGVVVAMIVVAQLWVVNLRFQVAQLTGPDLNRVEESNASSTKATADSALQKQILQITHETPSLFASVKSGFKELSDQFKRIVETERTQIIENKPDGQLNIDVLESPKSLPVSEKSTSETQDFNDFLDVYDQYYQSK